MVGRKPTRREQAVEYFLAHPDAKDVDVVEALGMDKSTVHRARMDLIAQGILPESTRRRAPSDVGALLGDLPKVLPPSKTPAREKPSLDGLLTDEDLRALDAENVDDAETRKSILKALRKIAFGRGVNYETAMSAMSLWVKLKDQAATKELGPGAPMTFAMAEERLKALMTACGFELVYKCFRDLFVPEESDTNEGQLPAEHDKATPSAAGTSSPSGSESDLPGDASPAGPQQLVLDSPPDSNLDRG